MRMVSLAGPSAISEARSQTFILVKGAWVLLGPWTSRREGTGVPVHGRFQARYGNTE